MVSYRNKVLRLFDKFRASAGATTPVLRQSVEEQAAAWVGGDAPVDITSLPEPLQRYLHKVALHAYRITDDDIDELRAVGHTEDEIFELTLSAALGAGRARLDLGLSLLRQGGDPCD